jgi:hypothetical protein
MVIDSAAMIAILFDESKRWPIEDARAACRAPASSGWSGKKLQ